MIEIYNWYKNILPTFMLEFMFLYHSSFTFFYKERTDNIKCYIRSTTWGSMYTSLTEKDLLQLCYGSPYCIGMYIPSHLPQFTFWWLFPESLQNIFLGDGTFFPQKDVEIALRQIKWISVVKGEGVNGDWYGGVYKGSVEPAIRRDQRPQLCGNLNFSSYPITPPPALDRSPSNLSLPLPTPGCCVKIGIL